MRRLHVCAVAILTALTLVACSQNNHDAPTQPTTAPITPKFVAYDWQVPQQASARVKGNVPSSTIATLVNVTTEPLSKEAADRIVFTFTGGHPTVTFGYVSVVHKGKQTLHHGLPYWIGMAFSPAQADEDKLKGWVHTPHLNAVKSYSFQNEPGGANFEKNVIVDVYAFDQPNRPLRITHWTTETNDQTKYIIALDVRRSA